MSHNTPKERRAHGAGWFNKLMAVLQGLMLIGAVLLALVLLILYPIWSATGSRPPMNLMIAIEPTVDLVSTIPGDEAVRSLELGNVYGEAKASFKNPWIQWFVLFFYLQAFIAAYLMLRFMRQVVRSVASGEPFSADNPRRLRWVGLLLILEALYPAGFSALLSKWVVGGLAIKGGTFFVQWESGPNLDIFLIGWLMLILSAAFSQGARMQHEQELTV